MNMEKVDVVKWIATIVQLIGYGMTGLNLVPYNIMALERPETIYYATLQAEKEMELQDAQALPSSLGTAVKLA